MNFKKIAAVAAAGSMITTAWTGTAAGAPVTKSGRGQVVSAELLAGLSRQETASYLAKMNFGDPAPKYGVDAYRVVYRTIDAARRPTTASGMVVLPRNRDRKHTTVVYEHGTNTTKKAAATTNDGSYDRAAAIMLGGAGFGTVAPDYLGLGLGPGRHPYMHHASEVTASLDLLRAADQVAAGRGRALDRRVRVTGFSQGGAAAMALSRALQRQGRLAAVAPVSGPYDVERAELPAALVHGSLDPKIAVVYLGYWLTSMNRIYRFYGSPAEMFAAPYDQKVEALFDGTHPIEEIATSLPGDPRDLLTPRAVKRLLDPTGPLARAMRENDDSCHWRPRVPVRIYAARGDKDVAIANAYSCQDALRARGARVPVIDVGDVDHTGSVFRALPRIVRWFR